jgi:hypothetical protein
MIVGACIARPLTGNIFFLSKIGVIGTLAFAGDREGLPYNCKGRVGGIGNVCPLRHGINAVPPPPQAVEALNILNRSGATLNFPLSIIHFQFSIIFNFPRVVK